MPNMPAVFREYKRLERLRAADGMSIEELQRWTHLKRLLTTHFRPGATGELADKQASLRVPTRLRVSFESYGELRQCLMTNISRGGVFVATDKPLPIGTPFALRIAVGAEGEPIELQGEVTTVNAGADMRTDQRGMGIRFTGLSEAQQELVSELYGVAMEAALETS